MRSFDIFDTLIARRCIQPEAVFFEVERRSRVDGFARVRYAAERAVDGGDYSLDDIYEHVARIGRIDRTGANALKAIEIAVEVDNVVPIADNIARLQSDSVLITDMYLPEHAIRAMLAAAGVPAHLCLVRTCHGKRSGEVWRALAAHGVHCDHLGDNAVADHQQALASGMGATLTAIATPTLTERLLLAAGCGHLAQAVRAARLMTPRGALPSELHRLQVELNLPMLLLSALHLQHLAAEGGHDRLLFSSRDGLYLQNIYQATGPERAGAYWYTSRVARSGDDAGYLDYCREAFGERPLLVDLCGTGASVARLRERLGMDTAAAPLFVTEWIESPGLEQDLAARYQLADVPRPAHLWSDRALVPNEVLELLNYVPEGMVRGVHRVPGGFVPDRAPVEFDARTFAQVGEQARFVGEYARHLKKVLSPAAREELVRLTGPATAALSQAVRGLVPEMQAVMAAWLPAHRANERALMAETLAA